MEILTSRICTTLNDRVKAKHTILNDSPMCYTSSMQNINIQHLRWISLIEGISYLLLVGIGMPLKYGLDILVINKVLGMIHGILTIVFVLILGAAYAYKRVSVPLTLFVFIASLIPFGAFVAEKKLKQL